MQFLLSGAEEVRLSWSEIDELPLPTFQWLVQRISQARKKSSQGTEALTAMVKSYEVLRRVKGERPGGQELSRKERIEARRRRVSEEASRHAKR